MNFPSRRAPAIFYITKGILLAKYFVRKYKTKDKSGWRNRRTSREGFVCGGGEGLERGKGGMLLFHLNWIWKLASIHLACPLVLAWLRYHTRFCFVFVFFCISFEPSVPHVSAMFYHKCRRRRLLFSNKQKEHTGCKFVSTLILWYRYISLIETTTIFFTHNPPKLKLFWVINIQCIIQ